jgi:hypothetical protein
MIRNKKSKDGGMTLGTDDLLKSAFAGRKLERELQICETARRVLSLCRYRNTEVHSEYVSPSARHAIFGMRVKRASLIQAWLASPMKWLDDVHKNGLALMSDCFVFEVVRRQDDGSLVVIAGRQGRGCSVHLAYGLALPSRGSWTLGWKGLPQEFQIELPKMSSLVDHMIEAQGEYYHEAAVRRALMRWTGSYRSPRLSLAETLP